MKSRLFFSRLRGLTWPARLASVAIFSLIVFLDMHLFDGPVTIVMVKLPALLIAWILLKWVEDRTAFPALDVLGALCIGLAFGVLCGHAVAGAYHFGLGATMNCVAGGAFLGLIVCFTVYAIVVVRRSGRGESSRSPTKAMLSERPPIVDQSPSTSCPINER